MFGGFFAEQTKKKARPRAPAPTQPIEKKAKKAKKKKLEDGPSPPIQKNSKAARELNAALSRLARGKQLSACRAAFASGFACGSTDAWSHAILINAHATCGDGAGALAALEAMRVAGHRPCVMSYTAALKAPCGRGDLAEARRILAEMEGEFAQRDRVSSPVGGLTDDYVPNIRTANTFLRGCLVAGGVDEASALLRRLGGGVWVSVQPDSSALEYCGMLCAQALRLKEAARLADRIASIRNGGAAQAAARVRVAACRGAALAGAWERCGFEADAARELLKAGDDEGRDGGDAGRGDGDGAPQRDSRAIFRQHQRQEALAQLDALERLARTSPPRAAAMPLLLRRALPLPAAAVGADNAVSHAEAALGEAFGLAQWRARLNRDAPGRGDAEAAALGRRLRHVLGWRTGGAAHGRLDLDALFAEEDAGDAADVLEGWLAPLSLDAIYCNHPEPPQQAASAGVAAAAPEATHMLSERLFDAAAATLRPGGTLTIVTDNAFYAELLIESLAAHGCFEPVPGARPKGARLVRAASGLELITAPPGPWCGHAAAGVSSYFDRLWKTGISVHSATHERYVLHCRARPRSTATC